MAAAAAQRALAAHPWAGGVALKVRMGLHTGEAPLVGNEYIGLDVHHAARIAAAAHGGQILISGRRRAGSQRTSCRQGCGSAASAPTG